MSWLHTHETHGKSMILLELLNWNREGQNKKQQKKNCALCSSLKAFSLVGLTSLRPEQAGVPRLKYGGFREEGRVCQHLSPSQTCIPRSSAWEHKFPDADGPASTQPNLSAPQYWWSPQAEGVWKTQLLSSSPGDGDSECSFLVSRASPRQDHTLQGTSMQAFRLVFSVRAEKEALGRQKPLAVFLGQDIPNDNPGSPDPVGLSFPQQSVRRGKVLPPCGHLCNYSGHTTASGHWIFLRKARRAGKDPGPTRNSQEEGARAGRKKQIRTTFQRPISTDKYDSYQVNVKNRKNI